MYSIEQSNYIKAKLFDHKIN